MKIINIVIIFLLFTNIGKSQNVVTFDRNVLQVNGQPFFMIGWYSHPNNYYINLMKQAPVNTILSYTHQVCENHPEHWIEYDSARYVRALKLYLDAAQTNNLMALVHIPYYVSTPINTSGRRYIGDDSWIDTLLSDPYIKKHPALLGWYLADEPEGDSIHIPVTLLRHWYKILKSKDPNHPVFLTYGGDPPRSTFNTYSIAPDSLYDVLMSDYYPFQNSIPLNCTGWAAMNLHDRIIADCKTGTTGSSAFVAQGMGVSNHFPDFRNPTTDEIKHQAFMAIVWGQNDQISNLGGLLYFWMDDANDSCRARVNNFISYFVGNELDKALIQAKITGLVGIDWDYTYPILRYYNGAYYFFVVNESDSTFTRTATFYLGNASSCYELNVPPESNSPVNLKPLGAGHYSIDSILLTGRQVRVFKIESPPCSLFLTKGWNLVSVPRVLSDYRVTSVFPRVNGEVVYELNAGWVPVGTVANGLGYMAYYVNSDTIIISGSIIISPIEIPVAAAGWVILGSRSAPVEVSSLIVSNGAEIFGGVVYLYIQGQGYMASSVIKPGEGAYAYIINATSWPCTITIPW